MPADAAGVLAWSKSRDATLTDCPRRYYFHYYGHRGGEVDGAPARTREIFLLRRLRSRYMWAGEVVHEAIEQLLRDLRAGVEPPAAAALLGAVRERMRADFRASRDRRRRRELESTGVALLEHEYGRPVTDAEWRAMAERVDACLEQFLAGGAFTRIRGMEPERDWIELEEHRSFDVDGAPVRVKLDFAHGEGADLVVLDWKTGKGRGDTRLQLGCYVLYLVHTRGVSPARVRGVEVNLASGRERVHRFDADDLDRVRQRIGAGLERMRRLLRDPTLGVAVEEDFAMNPAPWRCRSCNYLRVCPQGESGWGGRRAGESTGRVANRSPSRERTVTVRPETAQLMDK